MAHILALLEEVAQVGEGGEDVHFREVVVAGGREVDRGAPGVRVPAPRQLLPSIPSISSFVCHFLEIGAEAIHELPVGRLAPVPWPMAPAVAARAPLVERGAHLSVMVGGVVAAAVVADGAGGGERHVHPEARAIGQNRSRRVFGAMSPPTEGAAALKHGMRG